MYWGVVFTAIGLAAVQAESRAPGGGLTATAPSVSLERLDPDTLPKEWGRWKREDFATRTRNPGSYFGEVSKMWTYQLGKNGAVFSLDYPFPAWHDLTRCYTGQGWVIDRQTVHLAADDTDAPNNAPPHGFVEVALTRPGYRAGYLLFSQYDGRGSELRPRLGAAGLSLSRHGTVLERWRRRLAGEADLPVGEALPVYQAQLFVETFTPLSPPEQEGTQAFFQQALTRVIQHLKGDSSQ